MKVLLSHPSKIENEAAEINRLVSSEDWHSFHLRKPQWTSQEISILLDQLEDGVKKKTVVHYHPELAITHQLKGYHVSYPKLKDLSSAYGAHSISCHTFNEIKHLREQFNLGALPNLKYCFLSPVYDSISKPGYRSKFTQEELKLFLAKRDAMSIIGLGGVTRQNYTKLLELGFDGGAFLGSVWNRNPQLSS